MLVWPDLDVIHLGLAESGLHHGHPEILLLTLTVEQECLCCQVQLLKPVGHYITDLIGQRTCTLVYVWSQSIPAGM